MNSKYKWIVKIILKMNSEIKQNDEYNKICKTHQDYEITNYCTSKNCIHKERFCCVKCLMESHSNHISECLVLKEIISFV